MLGTRMPRWVSLVALGAVVALGACDPGSGDGSLVVDDCTLLTNEEVSAFAGTELAASNDGPQGCAYVAPGQTRGDFGVRAFRQSGDAAAAGARLAPSLEVVRLTGVGDDAVALATSDGTVNFLIARKGNLYVELTLTSLHVPKDPAFLARAGQVASTALARLAAAA